MFKRTGKVAGRFVASHGARHSDRSLQRLGERRRRWSLVDYDGQAKQVAIAFRPASIASLAEQKAGVSFSSVSVIGNGLRFAARECVKGETQCRPWDSSVHQRGAAALLAGCTSTSAARSQPTPNAATAPAGK